MTLPPLDPPVEAALNEAAEALRGTRQLGVACHISPDGDALGSILAVALALEPLGTTVAAGWGSEEIEIPVQYGFLPRAEELLVAPDRFPDRPQVVLTVDCATADRLGCLQERILAARTLVNLDHHVSNTRFGTIDVVDPSSASSAELVLRLLLRLGAEISPDVALCLYTGLFTDTGRFSYASVTPRAHATAAYLIERGVEVDAVAQAVYESLPYGYLKLLGRVLGRCRRLEDPPLVVSWQTQDDLAECGIGLDETEDVINVLRSTREADAAAILKELPDGRWKGSLRSKGKTDVGTVAQALEGGGHRLAAGFEVSGDLEETISRIHGILRDGA